MLLRQTGFTYTHRDTITGESCAAAERMLLAIVLFALRMSLVHALVASEGGSVGVCVLGEGSASGCGPCACLYGDR